MNDIEKKLIEKAVSGDVKSFEEIVRLYEKTVYNIAFYMFKNEYDAYDISQEVFIKIYKYLKSFKFDSSLATWINRITKNTCIDEIRKRKKMTNDISIDEDIDDGERGMKRQIADEHKTPLEEALDSESKEMVKAAINQLNEEYRMIIILRHLKEYSYDEISQTLEINVGTVKSRLSRARRQLKEIIIKMTEHT